MIILIYALRDENRFVRYVGKTRNALEWRLASHLKSARDGDASHKGCGIRKILQKGQIPTITLITIANGNGNAEEKAWIAYFRSYGINLWNETDGGDGWPTGKRQTPESIAKWVAKNTGQKRSPEQIQRISDSQKGKVLSVAHRAAISKTSKGRVVLPVTREKIRKALKGKPFSETHKKNLRGVKRSEAFKRKMSVIVKAYYAKRSKQN